MGPVLHADRFADGQLPVNDDSGGRIERFDPEPARRSTNGGLSEQFSSRVVGRCATSYADNWPSEGLSPPLAALSGSSRQLC